MKIDSCGVRIGAVAGKGFYICRPTLKYPDRSNKVEYLHKDLTWHDLCGSENFYETLDEAKEQIKLYEEFIIGEGKPFITEQEMIL